LAKQDTAKDDVFSPKATKAPDGIVLVENTGQERAGTTVISRSNGWEVYETLKVS